MTLKVVIDAGHGFETPGKRSPDGMREYEFNRVVAQAMRNELMNFENVEVLFTHSDSYDVPLSTRTNKANSWGADVFVSIHANAYLGVMGNHGGIDTFVYESMPSTATKLAKVVQRNLISATGLKDRGVKGANFHVLRESRMTAILIEHGFMDSYTDLPKLKSDSYRKLCGVTNARSIAEFYGLKRKYSQPEPTPEPTESATPQTNEEENKLAVQQRNKEATGFIDVSPSSAYAEAVKFLKDEGITSGYTDGSFKPDNTITRGEVALFLYRALNK